MPKMDILLNTNKPAKKLAKCYLWIGVNNHGEQLCGKILASSLTSAQQQLSAEQIAVISITKSIQWFTPLDFFQAKLQHHDITLLTRQIATMLNAGVPLMQALAMLNSCNHHPQLDQLLTQLKSQLEMGEPLSKCLQAFPQYFDHLFCDLVLAGEQSGTLATIFTQIAEQREKLQTLKSKIKNAMIYPTIVILVALIVSAILLIFVVPIFQDIFTSFDAELPQLTQMVIVISELLQQYWWSILALIILLILSGKWAYQQHALTALHLDKFFLKLPIIGAIIKKSAIARFALILSTTFNAGVPLSQALDYAARASGNFVFQNAILDMQKNVIAGISMHLAMQNTQIFPNIVVQMLAIGEQSGTIDSMLTKVTHIYKQDVDNAITRLTTLLEPIIMVFLGCVIGGLIVAMYLPIFQIASVL